MEDEKPVKMSIYLAEDTRARFKSACALEKRSMNEVLTDFIEGYIRQKEAPSPKKGKKE